MKHTLYKGDCLEIMKKLIDKNIKVDLVLTDIPYGTTQNKWDTIINLDKMWERINGLCNENTPILLFSAQPFTSNLVMSNVKCYKYEWIWHKTHPKGHLNAKKMPMRAHENIEVFYKKPPIYNPQMTHNHKRKVASTKYTRINNGCYGNETRDTYYDSTDRYPLDVQVFSNADQNNKIHPTQKPVELMEYFINTYTNEEMTVLDFTFGSNSTGIACLNTNRNYIGIEMNDKYFNLAKERTEKHILDNNLQVELVINS